MRTINTDPKHSFDYTQIPNHGFTFALLEEDRYLHTPFMCKDYLQDIFWSELTGGAGKAHGLRWRPGMYPVRDRIELAVYNEVEGMGCKIPALQEFLNWFEAAQKIEPTVVTPTKDPKLIIVEFSKAWTASGPMISAFTSLIRLAGGYTGGGPVPYLRSLNKKLVNEKTGERLWSPEPEYMTPEITRYRLVLPRLLALLDGKPVPEKWHSNETDIHDVHDYGIVGAQKFPS